MCLKFDQITHNREQQVHVYILFFWFGFGFLYFDSFELCSVEGAICYNH